MLYLGSYKMKRPLFCFKHCIDRTNHYSIYNFFHIQLELNCNNIYTIIISYEINVYIYAKEWGSTHNSNNYIYKLFSYFCGNFVITSQWLLPVPINWQWHYCKYVNRARQIYFFWICIIYYYFLKVKYFLKFYTKLTVNQ